MVSRTTKTAMQPKPLNFMLPALLAAALWFLPEMTGLHSPAGSRPFVLLGTYTLFSLPSAVAHVVQFFVCLAVWFCIMTLCENKKIIPVRSALTFSVGIILSSAVTYTQYFDHQTVAFILFLLAFHQLLSMYGMDNRLSSAFNITLLLSLSSLFNSCYAFLLPLFLLGMFIFRALSLRIILAALTGVLLPAFLLVSAFFLTDSMESLGSVFAGLRFYDFSRIEMPRSNIFMAASLLIVSAVSLISYFVTSVNYTLNVHLNFIFINWSFWLSLGWTLLFFHSYTDIIAVPLFFIVLCLSLYFSTNYNKVSSVLFLLFIAVCAAYRIFRIFGL